MITATTGGQWVVIYDECACCKLDTGGNHESGCPLKTGYVSVEPLIDKG